MRNEILLEVHMETPCGNPAILLPAWSTNAPSVDRPRVYTDRGDPKHVRKPDISRGTLQEPQR